MRPWLLACSVALALAVPAPVSAQEGEGRRKPTIAVGVGSGFTGLYAGRPGGRRTLRTTQGAEAEKALDLGLKWLAGAQAPDGSWDASAHGGDARFQVGATALALLALMGDGTSLAEGPHKKTVTAGIQWLRKSQDTESGRIASADSLDPMREHALATWAIVECFALSKSPLVRKTAERAVKFLAEHGGAEIEATFALVCAAEAGLEFDRDVLATLASTLAERTSNGGRVSVAEGDALSEHAATSAGLLARVFLRQTTKEQPVLERSAKAIAKHPLAAAGDKADRAALSYAAHALFQMGGDAWQAWREESTAAVVHAQEAKGELRGSWSPAAEPGGRVEATAEMALTLEAGFRYARVMGTKLPG
ncbi:MAG: hypothetical protein AAF682_32240 [Planctomycetota bacterium]